jgi:hypothetical protein
MDNLLYIFGDKRRKSSDERDPRHKAKGDICSDGHPANEVSAILLI